jgi:hypothetical protein
MMIELFAEKHGVVDELIVQRSLNSVSQLANQRHCTLVTISSIKSNEKNERQRSHSLKNELLSVAVFLMSLIVDKDTADMTTMMNTIMCT